MPERSKWTLLAWAVGAALAAVLLFRAGSAGTGEAPPVALRGGGDGGAGEPDREGGGRARVYVHVAGAVRRPGLYRIPAGSRVAAAVDAAGGPSGRAELGSVNLAARVEDGQQVVLPRLGAAGAGARAGPGAGVPGAQASPAGPKISLGSATPEQLESLDGIGPTLARRIIAFRDSHGGFRSIGQLREVEGIGEKRFAALARALAP